MTIENIQIYMNGSDEEPYVWDALAAEYARVNREVVELTRRRDELKAKLIGAVSGDIRIGGGLKVSRYSVKGIVDSGALYEAYGISEKDLDMYRKDASLRWRIDLY